MAPYWQRRMSRRRALKTATTSMVAGAGAMLIACGSSSGNSAGSSASKNQQLQGKISVASDSTSQAKRGGIYQSVVNTDETNLDPFTTSRGAGSGGVEK